MKFPRNSGFEKHLIGEIGLSPIFHASLDTLPWVVRKRGGCSILVCFVNSSDFSCCLYFVMIHRKLEGGEVIRITFSLDKGELVCDN